MNVGIFERYLLSKTRVQRQNICNNYAKVHVNVLGCDISMKQRMALQFVSVVKINKGCKNFGFDQRRKRKIQFFYMDMEMNYLTENVCF